MTNRFAASKFRNMRPMLYAKDAWYPDLTPFVGGDGQHIAASFGVVAIVHGNGQSVLPLLSENVGKRKGPARVIHAHSGEVRDLQFSPFNDNHLYTASDDCTAKLWDIPARGLTSDIQNATVVLKGHKRRVEVVRPHPAASGICATGSNDKTVRVWDVESNGKETTQFGTDIFDNWVQGLAWNYTGSTLAATARDKKLYLLDPRSGSVIATTESHDGTKAQRVVWAGRSDRVITVGFSKMRDRQVRLWDSRKLDTPLTNIDIDSSTGVMTPFYDADAEILFVNGVGDSSVKLWELDSENKFNELEAFGCPSPSKGMCLLPKRACHVEQCEVDIVLALSDREATPVSFFVPRKNKRDFAEDLYPLTASAEPSMTAAEWLGGANTPPEQVSLDPAKQPKVVAEQQAVEAEKEAAEAEAQAAAEAEEEKKYNGPKIVRSSHYRHLFGKPWQQNTNVTNFRLNSNTPTPLRVNPTYYAVPWTGAGGQLAVIPTSFQGRLPNEFPVIEVGYAVTDFAWNPFNDAVLATGDEGAHVKVWKIPEGGLGWEAKGANFKEHAVDLQSHRMKVLNTIFHPWAANVLFSSSYDNSVVGWDIEAGEEKVKWTIGRENDDVASSLTYDYLGNRLASINTGRDKKLTIWDARNGNETASTLAHVGAKPANIVWLGKKEQIMSIGFAKNSTREFMLFDTRNFDKPLAQETMPTQGSGVITPYYDMDTSVLYMSGKGDGTISFYEVVDDAPYVHFLSGYASSKPALSVQPMPKRVVDVKAVETMRFIKLRNDNTLETIPFFVPRTRTEFFQDDIYPESPDTGKPGISASGWFGGADAEPSMIDMRPAGMVDLSDAPKVVVAKKKFDYGHAGNKAKEYNTDTVSNAFFDKMQEHRESEDEVVDGGELSGCDSDEWGDDSDDDF